MAEAYPFGGSAGLEHSVNQDCGERRGDSSQLGSEASFRSVRHGDGSGGGRGFVKLDYALAGLLPDAVAVCC